MLEDAVQEMHVIVENQDNKHIEEGENPLAQFWTPSLEKILALGFGNG